MFYVDGVLYRTETTAKYCLFGGDVCAPSTLSDGQHIIVAKIYDKTTGVLLGTQSITIGQGTPTSTFTPTPTPIQTPAPTPTPIPITSGKLVFTGDYETGTYSSWTANNWQAWVNSGYNYNNKNQWEYIFQPPTDPVSEHFSLVTNPVRQGKYAGKFIIDSGSTIGGERTEVVSFNPPHWNGDIGNGNDFYYAFSVYIPNNYTYQNNWQVFWQVHSANYQSNPEVSLSMQDDTGRVFLGLHGGACNPSPPPLEQPFMGVYFTKEEWHDWIVHVKWSQTNTGMVEVYHKLQNEQKFIKVYTKLNYQTVNSNCPIWGAGENSIRTQIGLYRGKIAGNPVNTIYNDGYRIGTTFDSVLY